MKKLYCIYLATLILLIMTSACDKTKTPSSSQTPRDIFEQPFTSTSPWNYPIGDGAIYEDIPNISNIDGGINYGGAWTTGIYKATESDRKARLYIYKFDTMWEFLSTGNLYYWTEDGEEKVISKDDPNIENIFREYSQALPRTVCNSYSTVVQSPPGEWTPPSDIRDITSDWPENIYVPENAVVSPDTDAHIAIYQPNGFVMEAYNAVILSNGDIVAAIASFTDPQSEGTGYQNGRTASLLPNYAGKIRKGEISKGEIPHALCITVPRAMLTPQIVWPAYAFDMHDEYSGTIPMGSLLAIPPTVDIKSLGLSEIGEIIAAAAQDHGLYVMDRGGDGITIQAELGNEEIETPEIYYDITTIVHNLQRITNNSETNRGGGGTLRKPLIIELTK